MSEGPIPAEAQALDNKLDAFGEMVTILFKLPFEDRYPVVAAVTRFLEIEPPTTEE